MKNGEYAARDHLGDSLNCPDSYRYLRNKSKSSLQLPYQLSCKNPPSYTSSWVHWLQQSCTCQGDNNVISTAPVPFPDPSGVCASEAIQNSRQPSEVGDSPKLTHRKMKSSI